MHFFQVCQTLSRVLLKLFSLVQGLHSLARTSPVKHTHRCKLELEVYAMFKHQQAPLLRAACVMHLVHFHVSKEQAGHHGMLLLSIIIVC